MIRRLSSALAVLLLVAGLSASPAKADCANPSGPEGRMMYNADHNVMQFCDGTHWIGMAGSTSLTDTMIDGWPDAIECRNGASKIVLC